MEKINDLFKYKDNFKLNSHIKSKLMYGDIRNNETPLVSIVIPTYKRPFFLKQAIDSALNQRGFNNYEVVVVDNEPISDSNKISETEQLISTYTNSKLFYYKNEKNIGMTGNWNRCIELARGKWVTMLHDDDCFMRNYLNEINKYFKFTDLIVPNKYVCKNEECSNEDYGDEDENFYINLKSKFFEVSKIKKWDFFWNNPVGAPIGTIFKKEKAIKIGGFDDKHYPCADLFFWYRYINQFNGIFLKKKLAIYRILVNESLNKKTLLGFIINDHLLRKIILEKNNFSSNFNSIILNAMIEKQTNNYEERFGYKFKQNVENDLNITLTKNIINIKMMKYIHMIYKVKCKFSHFFDNLFLKLKMIN
jgi:glycosyltransferase involved in cell wall biosynthesis